MNEKIQQEMALVDQDHPTYLRQFQQIMRQGEVDGSTYNIEPCGCFYGWLNYLEYDDGKDGEILAYHYNHQFSERPSLTLTPIEHLIRHVDSGETPEESLALRTLNQEIEEYFAQKGGTL